METSFDRKLKVESVIAKCAAILLNSEEFESVEGCVKFAIDIYEETQTQLKKAIQSDRIFIK